MKDASAAAVVAKRWAMRKWLRPTPERIERYAIAATTLLLVVVCYLAGYYLGCARGEARQFMPAVESCSTENLGAEFFDAVYAPAEHGFMWRCVASRANPAPESLCRPGQLTGCLRVVYPPETTDTAERP